MQSRLQPVAVEDVVTLLGGALGDVAHNRHYDVGGDAVMTYPELLATIAGVMGVRRPQFVLPGAPKRAVGAIVAGVTGMDRPTVTALVDSLSYDMVCREDDACRDLAADEFRYLPPWSRPSVVRWTATTRTAPGSATTCKPGCAPTRPEPEARRSALLLLPRAEALLEGEVTVNSPKCT